MLNQAIEALKTYDYGMDRHLLDPIEEAVISSRNDAAARKDLESQLLAVLTSSAPRDARDYVCRVLRTIGTAASVPALEALLGDAEMSHMARYALERIPDAKAGQALERQLGKVAVPLKVGIIGSLGTRGQGVRLLRSSLGDSDEAVARAAAIALGHLGTAEASKALSSATARPALAVVLGDAALSCAEKLLAAGHGGDAKAAYQRLLQSNPPALIQAAAERGLKACG